MIIRIKNNLNYSIKFLSFLIIATENGYIDIVKLLIKYKAGVNIIDKYNQTALLIGFY